MVMAYVALNLVWLFVWFTFASRLTAYNLLLFLKDIAPFGFAAAGVMLITGYITMPIESLWQLLLSRVIVATLLYLLVMKVAGAKMLDETLTFLKNKFKR